jgi:hypothetical protein
LQLLKENPMKRFHVHVRVADLAASIDGDGGRASSGSACCATPGDGVAVALPVRAQAKAACC